MELNANSSTRILELLNLPFAEKCTELGFLFDKCSLRELQEVFPNIIKSIFDIDAGGLGWGLRTTTRENSPEIFDALLNFFSPLGPMFRLCYRLLNDAIKFECDIELLPNKMNEMLLSGNYASFYSDLIQIDPFRRTISSLSLNSFDYFMLNFTNYGTLPLHKTYPQALSIHNENLKSVYFWLAAEYIEFFLPKSLDQKILPTNICKTVKAPQVVPVQPLQPTKSPKYLKLSPISSHFGPTNQNTSSSESPRTYAWRTESVLYLFVDSWLRFNVDGIRDLPSSEFVRLVRVLIKALHAFANAAEIDNTSMSVLRKLALPMMKVRFYPFIKSLIARWPLDASLYVVLELWLSYIQPWRYNYYINEMNPEQPLTNYESFISENIVVYTQVFIDIAQRFSRLDFTSYRNAIMLHRITKVFNQGSLPVLLKAFELRLNIPLSTSLLSPSNRSSSASPYQYTPKLYNSRQAGSCMSDYSYSIQYESFHNESALFQEENYIPMFGEEFKNHIQEFIKLVCIAKIYVIQDIDSISAKLGFENREQNFLKRLLNNFFQKSSPLNEKLKELVRIPNLLDFALQSLSSIFQLNLSDIKIGNIEPRELEFSESDSNSDTERDIRKLSPFQMKKRAYFIRPTIDPALAPIQSYECTILVRFLHQVSCKLNTMFQNEILKYYNRRDFWGKVARQILYKPMVSEWFDKSKGFSELCQKELPPRICLRPLASYKAVFLILFSLIIGKLIWGFPSYGLFLICNLFLIKIFVLALFEPY